MVVVFGVVSALERGGEWNRGTWGGPAYGDGGGLEPGAERGGGGRSGAGAPPATRGVSPLFGTGAGRPDRRRDACATTMRQVEEGEHHRFSEAAKRLCRISLRLAGQFQTESLADQTDEMRIGPEADS